jgi:hypothetical protein
LPLCLGVVLRWRNPAFLEMQFSDHAKRLESAPAGTVITIPENPPGWNLQIVKH